jgi:LysM repeat protein
VPILATLSVVGVLALSRLNTTQSEVTPLAALSGTGTQVVLDEVASADIAAGVAEVSGLLVAEEAVAYADKLKGETEMTAVADNEVLKPQIVKTDAKTRQDIEKHAVKKGESLSEIANDYNVTTDTIKWANNLTDDDVKPGTKLTILPVSGVLHTVNENETAEEIAKKYHANAVQIINFNDAELTGLQAGTRIVVPEGKKPDPVVTRRSFFRNASPVGNRSYNFYSSSSTLLGRYTQYGNPSGYARGWCTHWAAYRAGQLGNPIGRQWGNAISWPSSARATGDYTVSQTPRVGPVGQRGNHVVVVEAVSEDGSMIKYSDMNGLAGWGNAAITNDFVPASGFWAYIHHK